MAGANFIGHTKDGFKATCIMETIERDTPMEGNYTEPIGCAMRGRNPENPSERGRGNGKYKQRIEMGSNISNTITSAQKDSLVIEPLRIPQATAQGYVEVEPGSLFDGSYPNSKIRRGRVQGEGKISPTLMAHGEPPNYYEGKIEPTYRIRKLTPRECFRLMGVTETNIDKIQQSGVSQSQQYKMAGNSIVVDVLEHIFRKLFIDTGQESQQLSLF
jgi:DNA (cytosine-5)-methyltransferase 1